MTRTIVHAALYSIIIGALSSASPTPPQSSPRSLRKRYENGVDCTDDVVKDNPPGLLVVKAGSDIVECDGIAEYAETYKTGDDYQCWMTDENGPFGRHVKCPGDKGPKKNPDGSDTDPSIAEEIIQTYCNTAGDGGIPAAAFVNTVGCLLFGYLEAGANVIAQNEAGASAVCDTITSGACTFFTDVAPELLDGMDTPCVDPPENPGLCDLAAPGR